MIDPMKTKIKICVNVDPDTLTRIDSIRGGISRSAFVNDALYWGFVASEEQIDAYR